MFKVVFFNSEAWRTLPYEHWSPHKLCFSFVQNSVGAALRSYFKSEGTQWGKNKMKQTKPNQTKQEKKPKQIKSSNLRHHRSVLFTGGRKQWHLKVKSLMASQFIPSVLIYNRFSHAVSCIRLSLMPEQCERLLSCKDKG